MEFGWWLERLSITSAHNSNANGCRRIHEAECQPMYRPCYCQKDSVSRSRKTYWPLYTLPVTLVSTAKYVSPGVTRVVYRHSIPMYQTVSKNPCPIHMIDAIINRGQICAALFVCSSIHLSMWHRSVLSQCAQSLHACALTDLGVG
jgi:hypothetical protein